MPTNESQQITKWKAPGAAPEAWKWPHFLSSLGLLLWTKPAAWLLAWLASLGLRKVLLLCSGKMKLTSVFYLLMSNHHLYLSPAWDSAAWNTNAIRTWRLFCKTHSFSKTLFNSLTLLWFLDPWQCVASYEALSHPLRPGSMWHLLEQLCRWLARDWEPSVSWIFN
jgi:hypothetical protein